MTQGLADYLKHLSDRLHRVRITCGDWQRVVQPSVHRAGTQGDGVRAIFLDPPYATSGDLYVHGDTEISGRVRDWCHTAPPELRIILCGYETEHDALLDRGWTVTEGKAGKGYSTRADSRRRERLWLSPACLTDHKQETMDFEDTA